MSKQAKKEDLTGSLIETDLSDDDVAVVLRPAGIEDGLREGYYKVLSLRSPAIWWIYSPRRLDEK